MSGDPLANAARTERARSNAGSGQAEAHDDDLFDFLDDRGSTGFGLASHAAGLARSGGAVGSGGGGAADQHANYLDREDNVPPEAAVSAFVCVAKLKLCALAAARHAADARADTVAGEVFAALDPTNTQFVSLHDVQRWLQQHAGCAALTAQDLFLIFGASSSSNGNDIKIREELSSLPPAHTEARDPVFGGEPSGGQDVRPSSGADEPEVAHLMDRASFRAALGLPPHRAVAALLLGRASWPPLGSPPMMGSRPSVCAGGSEESSSLMSLLLLLLLLLPAPLLAPKMRNKSRAVSAAQPACYCSHL